MPAALDWSMLLSVAKSNMEIEDLSIPSSALCDAFAARVIMSLIRWNHRHFILAKPFVELIRINPSSLSQRV